MNIINYGILQKNNNYFLKNILNNIKKTIDANIKNISREKICFNPIDFNWSMSET